MKSREFRSFAFLVLALLAGMPLAAQPAQRQASPATTQARPQAYPAVNPQPPQTYPAAPPPTVGMRQPGVSSTLTTKTVTTTTKQTAVTSKPGKPPRATYKEVMETGQAPFGTVRSNPVQAPQAPRMEQLPARPPVVTYRDGMMSIQAENSTLGDIINAVRKNTGAQVDITGTGASERVVLHAGPAPADTVLAKLFNGSKFDYIILNSAEDPRELKQIILKEKTSGPTTPNAGLQPAQAYNQPPVQPQPRVEEPQEDTFTVPEAEAPEENVPQPGSAPVMQQQQLNMQQSPPNPDNPKTPEQLLDELKQLQQQQQMQQQQQPPQQRPDGDPAPQ